jgi:hypothetical protein
MSNYKMKGLKGRIMKRQLWIVWKILGSLLLKYSLISQNLPYTIVETGVKEFYNNTAIIQTSIKGSAFYGQDASYTGNEPSYTDNGDGTITDNVTGLIWQKDMGIKLSFNDAIKKADTLRLGGYSDWRIPTIKELYSLILFTGRVNGEKAITKFIDTNYFIQSIGNTAAGEREIDAQVWSSTHYMGLTMNADSTVFGVNFIDGRIKGYPKYKPGSNNRIPNTMYFRMVRGNKNYGINNFVDNGDGTISDKATGLMWQKSDDGISRDWQDALNFAENLILGNYSDWRLPNAKELQSIVDYTRSPSFTNSAAINPIFNTTSITYPDGNGGQYPYFWTSTTHLDGTNPYSSAVYIAFGKALGKMNGVIMDVHGAGAQRSDPKTGNAADYPQYMGPQGDLRSVFNYVRCVRNISSTNYINSVPTPSDLYLYQNYPNPFNPSTMISFKLPAGSHVTLKIYDILGKEITTLINEYKASGFYSIEWKPDNLPSGVYFYRIKAGSKEKTGIMAFQK